MADEEHLKILKQGVKVWNAWREKHRAVATDLRSDDFSEADLSGANLYGRQLQDANLTNTDLSGTNLRRANLFRADLSTTNLRGANLRNAILHCADLSHTNLRGADLTSVYLPSADLSGANLRDAILSFASLSGVDLTGADLSGADLRDAAIDSTTFARIDLSQTKGLDDCRHHGSSTIGTDTLCRSKGQISEVFLRGCGLADWEIAAAKLHAPGLTSEQVIDLTYEIARIKAESPIQINPIFISYSRSDSKFVKALEPRLDEKRIRYWRDVHDLKAGRLETQIDRAIRHNPIVLLVLSEASVESDWVEWEVSKAREIEKQEKRDVLCPIALDDAWKTCSWPGRLRRQIEDYNILDFSEWRDDPAMKRQFQKLIDGLGMFYPTAG